MGSQQERRIDEDIKGKEIDRLEDKLEDGVAIHMKDGGELHITAVNMGGGDDELDFEYHEGPIDAGKSLRIAVEHDHMYMVELDAEELKELLVTIDAQLEILKDVLWGELNNPGVKLINMIKSKTVPTIAKLIQLRDKLKEALNEKGNHKETPST